MFNWEDSLSGLVLNANANILLLLSPLFQHYHCGSFIYANIFDVQHYHICRGLFGNTFAPTFFFIPVAVTGWDKTFLLTSCFDTSLIHLVITSTILLISYQKSHCVNIFAKASTGIPINCCNINSELLGKKYDVWFLPLVSEVLLMGFSTEIYIVCRDIT